MRIEQHHQRRRPALLQRCRLWLTLAVWCWIAVGSAKCDEPGEGQDKLYGHYGLNMHKVVMTQKGYIQFLRYITHIPPIKDFTFCLWIKSFNFTYSHPILSYSHHEHDRHIRAWIAPYGHEINLAIEEVPVIKVPVHLEEHKWHHICQSWSSHLGHWALFLNGNQLASGYNEKLKGVVLPPHGDLVVGQEYTDFDKGLEDGIEGAVFGFNLVLSSVVGPSIPKPHSHHLTNKRFPSNHHSELFTPSNIKHFGARNRPSESELLSPELNFIRRHEINEGDLGYVRFDDNHIKRKPSRRYRRNLEDIANSRSMIRQARSRNITFVDNQPSNNLKRLNLQRAELPINTNHTRSRSEIPRVYDFDRSRNNIQKVDSSLRSDIQRIKRRPNMPIEITTSPAQINRNYREIDRRIMQNKNVRRSPSAAYTKSLGQHLVELSYTHCLIGRGAPLSDPNVLISWTKTIVRVFGGAILKPAKPFCGDF